MVNNDNDKIHAKWLWLIKTFVCIGTSAVIAVTQNEPGTDECWQSKLSHVWVTELHIPFIFRLVVSALPFYDEYYANASWENSVSAYNMFNRTSRSVSLLVAEYIFFTSFYHMTAIYISKTALI